MNQLKGALSVFRRSALAGLQGFYQSAVKPVRGMPGRWPSAWLSTWSIGRLPLLQHDRKHMESSASGVWRRRRQSATAQLAHMFRVALTYLFSELVIWGLSRVLAPVKIEFFSSIISMLLVFALITAAYFAWRPVEKAYQHHIKPQVDFINTHMGIGFPVPIVMLNENDILHGHDIARILGNAVMTNIISWTSVFLLSYLLWSTYLRVTSPPTPATDGRGLPRPLTSTPPRIDITWYPDLNSNQATDETGAKSSRPGTSSPSLAATRRTSTHGPDSPASRSPGRPRRATWWTHFDTLWPVGLALACVFLIGAPVTAGAHDGRLLDAFVLWLLWISAVTGQRTFKKSCHLRRHSRVKTVLATLMNPVLITTLLMVGYTRVKSQAIHRESLGSVLGQFSAGSPLYALWTAKVQDVPTPRNPEGWFGAGDAALSVLECGIFVWGFKLFECRSQLFSIAGVLTIVISVVAAVGNVFLSVLAGSAMGLEKPEALAFAARCATLALAKPAIEAVGGNMVVNAALVVGNGILGQLLYPFTLDMLGVKTEKTPPGNTQSLLGSSDVENEKLDDSTNVSSDDAWVGQDDAVTIAAGIAIGINGAAMGVAYLYETRSRAAPYAALSMTVFGVMTVIFTTVGPFKALVISLASG